jgi:hypothetical protein
MSGGYASIANDPEALAAVRRRHASQREFGGRGYKMDGVSPTELRAAIQSGQAQLYSDLPEVYAPAYSAPQPYETVTQYNGQTAKMMVNPDGSKEITGKNGEIKRINLDGSWAVFRKGKKVMEQRLMTSSSGRKQRQVKDFITDTTTTFDLNTGKWLYKDKQSGSYIDRVKSDGSIELLAVTEEKDAQGRIRKKTTLKRQRFPIINADKSIKAYKIVNWKRGVVVNTSFEAVESKKIQPIILDDEKIHPGNTLRTNGSGFKLSSNDQAFINALAKLRQGDQGVCYQLATLQRLAEQAQKGDTGAQLMLKDMVQWNPSNGSYTVKTVTPDAETTYKITQAEVDSLVQKTKGFKGPAEMFALMAAYEQERQLRQNAYYLNVYESANRQDKNPVLINSKGGTSAEFLARMSRTPVSKIASPGEPLSKKNSEAALNVLQQLDTMPGAIITGASVENPENRRFVGAHEYGITPDGKGNYRLTNPWGHNPQDSGASFTVDQKTLLKNMRGLTWTNTNQR